MTRETKQDKVIEVPTINFLGEQNGLAETDFKKLLTEHLSRDSVIGRAYLARVNYGDTEQTNIALCIKKNGAVSDQLIPQLVGCFKLLFTNDNALDILFLDDVQELKIKEVCRPFYVQKIKSDKP